MPRVACPAARSDRTGPLPARTSRASRLARAVRCAPSHRPRWLRYRNRHADTPQHDQLTPRNRRSHGANHLAVAGRLRIAVRARPFPADPWHRAIAPRLRALGHEVDEGFDEPLDLDAHDLVLLCEEVGRFPALVRQLEGRPPGSGPLVALWSTEPMPPPQSSGRRARGVSRSGLCRLARRRPGDRIVRTNLQRQRRAVDCNRVLDIVVVTTRGAQAALAERGLAAEWVPLGHDAGWYGRDLGLERDVDVLFLGELRVPRRRRLLAALRAHGNRAARAWEAKHDPRSGARRTLS